MACAKCKKGDYVFVPKPIQLVRAEIEGSLTCNRCGFVVKPKKVPTVKPAA